MTPQTEAAKAPKRAPAPKAAATPAKRAGKASTPRASAQAAVKAARGAKKSRADILAAAQKGKLPTAPDFSAETHKRFRPLLDKAIELAKAGDIAGLKALDIKPVSSSPKAVDRYRNLAVIALEAQTGVENADVV